MDMTTIAAQAVAALLGSVGGGLLGAIVAIYLARGAKKAASMQVDAVRDQLAATNEQLRTMEKQLIAATEATTRTSHNDLLKLVLQENDLWKVWCSPGQDEVEYKQNVFVNMHLSHLESLYKLDRLSAGQVKAELLEHFGNPIYQRFWKAARRHRHDMLPATGTKADQFHALCEDAYTSAP